jgi:hypothetical protein
MNCSLVTVDVTTQPKIVAMVLLAVILIVWIGLGTRLAF